MAELALLYLCFGIAWALVSLMEVYVAMTKPTTERHRQIYGAALPLLNGRYVSKPMGIVILTIGVLFGIVVNISLWLILAVIRVVKEINHE